MAENFGSDIELLEKLDSGGMAEVFRAKLVGTGGFEKVVAVKRILPHFANQPAFRSKFQSEMNLVAKLQHPNLVQVFQNGERGEFLYLVMEFVNGKNVGHFIEVATNSSFRIPVPAACHICLEVAKGLEYAHNYCDELTGEHQRIVHRDINPANIMLSYTGEVKIVDFGIAKVAGQTQATRVGDLKGTIPYCSPEQIEGLPLDRRTDIFSMGIVLYELLTQRRLFAAEGTFEIMRQVRDCQIPDLVNLRPDISPELAAVVYKALAKNREDRYQTCEELIRDLGYFRNKHYPNSTDADFGRFVATIFADEIQKELVVRRSGAVKTSGRPVTEETIQVSLDDFQKYEKVRSTQGIPSNLKTGALLFRSDRLTLFLLTALVACVTVLATIYTKNDRVAPTVSVPAAVKPVRQVGLDPNRSQASYDSEQSIKQLPGLVSWFSADNLTKLSGDHLNNWPDQIYGEIEMKQGLVKSRPEFGTDSNGFHFVAFDGRDDFMMADDMSAALRSAKAFSLVVVAAVDSDRSQALFSVHKTDRKGDVLRFGFNTNGRIRCKTDVVIASYQDSGSGIVPEKELALYVMNVQRSSAAVYLNGQNIYEWTITKPIAYSDIAAISLGQEWDGTVASDFFSGRVYEVLVFSRDLLNVEQVQLENFMLNKYAIK